MLFRLVLSNFFCKSSGKSSSLDVDMLRPKWWRSPFKTLSLFGFGLFLSGLTLLVPSIPSQAVPIHDVPNPKATNDTWVTDMVGVLNDSTTQQLNICITNFEAETHAEIAVVVVPETQPVETPRDYAIELFNTWGIGKAVQNNGVLILLSMGDRRVELVTGRGIESMLTDAEAQEIINTKMLPSLSRDRPNEAVLQGTDAVIEELERELAQGQPGIFASVNLPEGVPLAIAGPGAIAGLALILSVVFGVKALQKKRSPAPLKPFEYSQWLWLEDDEKTQIRACKKKKARYDDTLRRFQSMSFILGTYAMTSVLLVVIAYYDPRWMSVAIGLSIPVIFAYKNLPRLRPSPHLPLPHERFSLGQLLWSTVGAFMFYGVVGLFGTGLVADMESPMSPLTAMVAALMVSGFTTINWRNFEDRSSGRRSSTAPSGYGGSTGASSSGSGGSGGGGFGGGSSDGGGAGGSW